MRSLEELTPAPARVAAPLPDPLGDPPADTRHLARAWPLSPYLRSDEAAEYLRFPNRKAFQEWSRRRRIPCCRRGRILLYERRVLDALVEADGRPGGLRRVR